jgi:hypothetical protein|tara:strand:- start:1323 stop:1559 length:237 start_codon:yes stop_codon:yes gene_type:complete
MAQIINLQVERAIRKCGMGRALIEDIINDGFDPCNKKEVAQYWDWFSVQSDPISLNVDWTGDAVERLLHDIVTSEVEK